VTTKTAENLGYTAQEIRDRMAISTAVFDLDSRIGAEQIAAVRQAGITRIEVCGLPAPRHFNYNDRAQVSEIVSACRSQGVEIVSMHGPGVLYASADEDVRKSAVVAALAAARVAEEMGAGVMVCHFGTDEQSERTIIEMLEGLDGSKLRLADENGQDLADYMALADRVGSDRFGMVVDVGHTRDGDGVNPFVERGRARGTMAQCGERLIHVHLHDFIETDHIAPLDGNLQWDEIFAAFRDIDYQGLFMFEPLYPAGKREQSPEYVIRKTAEFPDAFVERYGSPA
jgi:sugar phosphate isomerase/epimerase